MSDEEELTLEPIIDHGCPDLPDYPQTRRRTIHLRFDHVGRELRLLARGPAFKENGGGERCGRLDAHLPEVLDAIDDVRDEWHRSVVRYCSKKPGSKNVRPFATWIPSPALSPTEHDDMMRKLARAGFELFNVLFNQGGPGLKAIGLELADALRSGRHIISVSSTHLFVPWGMIYTPPDSPASLYDDNADWSYNGFWGYRHLVEQTTDYDHDFDSRISKVNGFVNVGMNVDHRLDQQFKQHPCVHPVVRHLKEKPLLDVTERRTRAHLARDLQGGHRLRDQIMYFGCHSEQIGAGKRMKLMLGDGEPIQRKHLKQWLNGGTLASKPVVFVNACQGGRLSSMFYPNFGNVLLKAGANCLLGPQVDIPPGFARQYAISFFNRFVLAPNRIGDVVHRLAQYLADDHNNPLGMTIALYRGLDTHIEPNI